MVKWTNLFYALAMYKVLQTGRKARIEYANPGLNEDLNQGPLVWQGSVLTNTFKVLYLTFLCYKQKKNVYILLFKLLIA